MGAVWRIRDRATFAALRRHGRRVRRGAVAVSFVAGDAGTPPRVAYAVSRNVGPAVVRNRVRRRLRAVVADLDLAPGAYLVRAEPASSELPFAELSRLTAAAGTAAAGDDRAGDGRAGDGR